MGLRIVADERERESGIPRMLSKMGVKVEFYRLEVGDYIVSRDVAVERKTLRDLVSSIYDGRLFDQCSRLSSRYRKPLLMVEGDLGEIPYLVESPKVVYGAFASVLLRHNIFTLHTYSPKETALALTVMAEHAPRERKPGPLLQKARKSEEPRLQQLYLVSALPGVGEKLAKRLLERFGTPRAVFSATAPDIARVPGVGRRRALRIRIALDTVFKPVNRWPGHLDLLGPDEGL